MTVPETTAEAIVAGAELPPLLAALAHATDDVAYLDPALAPPLSQRGARLLRHGGMDPDAVAKATDLARRGVRDLPSEGSFEVRTELLDPTLEFLSGRLLAGSEDLLRHELLGPEEPPSLREAGLAAVVVGAGVSGIAAAIQLRAAGVEVTLLEKNAEAGGTWWENTYPGCRLDTPNFTYSFSFDQREVWPDHYTLQPDLRDYLLEVVARHDLRDHIRFGRDVTQARWDQAAAQWVVEATGPDGAEELRAEVLVTAVGQLNRPFVPDLPGLDTFPGPVMHSASWNHDVSLAGRKLAVIGTGASAFQIVPAVADQVAELTVFQRNPPWMLPTPNYTQPIEGAQRQLFEQVPGYGRWYRFWQFVLSMEAWLPLVEVDPDWQQSGSVSALNQQFREELLAALGEQFSDRPDLLSLCTPSYPPGTKRMLRDDGSWGQALRQPHVQVVTSGVQRIEGSRVVASDGTAVEVDAIVFATGFRAEEFLAPMHIVGRDDVTLSQMWDGDARAYATTSVPGFPNMFMMLGPNSGLAANGSIIFMSECAAEYTVRCLAEMVDHGARAMEPTTRAFEEFTDRIDAANRSRAWGVPGASTWYQSRSGRVVANWPGNLSEYWDVTHRVACNDFDFDIPGGEEASRCDGTP